MHSAAFVPNPTAVPAPVGRLRWLICSLLFFATTVNYIDRQVIGILKPELTRALGFSELDYANIVFWFQVAYALGSLGAGRMLDWTGVRLGYAGAVALWSVAAMLHALASSVFGFTCARMALGFAEGANFPAAVKAVSEWFPKQERALATGLFNAGSNVGALITPLLVPWLTVRFGWPAAFLVTGFLGLIWLLVWWPNYRAPEDHPNLSPAEHRHIRSDPPDRLMGVGWLKLLRHRQTWMFVVGMFLCSPIWWFWLFWIPGFLYNRYGTDLLQLGPPIAVIYLMTSVGSIGGGWLSSHLLRLGWSVNAARKTAMLVCALCVVPVFAASQTGSLWTATLLIGLAASAHQGFAANLFTLVSDTVPRPAISSVVGLGSMAGSIGGMVIAKITGYVLEWTGNYLPLFLIASMAYCIALLCVHLINPRLEPMRLEAERV